LLTTVAVPALAADAVVDEVVIVDTAYNWSGVYVGGALGWASIDYDELVNEFPNREDDGFAAAVYVGYNFQMDNFVFGVEGDLNFRAAEPEDPNTNPLSQNLGGSVRGRIGYAFDRIMPYFTAGLAVANFEADHDGNGADIAEKTMTGYAVGAGVEWAVTDNLIVRGQYLYSDYGKDTFEFDGNHEHEYDVVTQDVLVGIAYKF
jgi:outer membrane immunogenic protein